MIGSRAYFALMRRNFIYRKRNIFGTLLEMALPVFFISILVIIKKSLENNPSFSPTTVNATFPSEPVLPFTFHDFSTALQAERICQRLIDDRGRPSWFISGMSPFDWQVPFVKCDSRLCEVDGESAIGKYCEYQILALAYEDANLGKTRAEQFQSYVYGKYSGLNTTTNFAHEFIRIFESEMAMEDYVTHSSYGGLENPKIGLGIVFEGSDPNDYAYKIRVNSTNFNNPENEGRPAITTTPPTDQEFDNIANNDEVCPTTDGGAEVGANETSCTLKYVYNGLLTVQRLVHDWILEDSEAASAGYSVAEHGVQFMSFPTKEYVEDGFYEQIAPFAPLLVVLGLLYPVAAMIRAITLEKQLRQKELMKMMSVLESDIGWSWFTSFFFFHFFTATFSAISTAALYSNSEGFFLWLFWFFGFTSVVVFTMVLASIFTRATTATLVGLLITFAGFFLSLSTQYDTGNIGVIGMVSLHPVAAIGYGMQEIGRLEDAGVGVTSATFNSTDNPSGFTFQSSLQSLIFDCVLWGIVCWYLNRVVKSDLGQPLPWYFPFTGSYWCGGGGSGISGPDDDDWDEKNADNVPIEQVGEALRSTLADGQGIQIRGLRKDFGDKTAVDGLSLSMYSNQITALLGHNGAGKTTTISMLTGMLAPTEGYAVVAGKDIRNQMNTIRKEIGICLQHDCLFPQLTVTEHIQFFSRLKGMYAKCSREEAAEKVKAAIEDVALYEKRNTLSKNLSGGMKRKLSVAIAFCGDSKTVLLDEPTSGMDPFSRRFTWNVIRQYRQDRCIILTTHFMDEADVLGDRIAIMAEGQLRCAGSSLFLKKQYGVGYQLTIEKKSKDIGMSSHHGRYTGEQDATVDDALKDIVIGSVADASLLSNVGTEMSFQLPIGASSEFTPMFEQLDVEVAGGTIVTYGVSITTLDEVFLLVARGETGEKSTNLLSSKNVGDAAGMTDDGDRSQKSRIVYDSEGLFGTHVKVLFQKRALNFKRDKKAWTCTTILPSLFVFFGLILFKYAVPTRNLDPLVLDLSSFNEDIAENPGPRNPIPFNSPDNPYICQPGQCITEFTSQPTFVEGPSQQYGFCGAGYYGLTGDSCLSTQQESVLGEIGANGATGIPRSVMDPDSSTHALFDSRNEFAAASYGALWFTHDIGTDDEFFNNTIAACQAVSQEDNFLDADFCDYLDGVGYVVSYNFTSIHVAPTFQALADEALMREGSGNANLKITPTIHPLPITAREDAFGSAEDSFNAWFLIVLSFPFIAGSFGTFIVSERASKAKHLQTVAGVKPAAYWISSYVWDIINYQLPCWITIILMYALGVDTFTTSERGVAAGTIVTLVLYGPAAAGFTYIVTFFFTNASMCNLVIIIFNFLIGLAGPLVSLILRLIGEDTANPSPNLVSAADIIEWILRFTPAFNLGSSLLKIINVEVFEFLKGKPITVWDPTVILYETIFQAMWGILLVLFAIRLDVWSTNPSMVKFWKMITCRGSGGKVDYVDIQPEDEDVVAEEERVLSGGANTDLIVLNKMTKQYPNGKVAVNNMSLGIPPGQCFGLLGINGAGKTTTMGMLTAEFPPTSGDATLAGYSVTKEPEKTRRRIGYCPQFDAHFMNMTGREHVALYAAIKGVPSEEIAEATAEKLSEVGLSEYDSDRLSSGYSGGMKRKLSVACATIGNPQIVFLDEPSTGMDPVARRDMWQVISDMVTGGNIPDEERTSVILTTHSMEECEALCSRIGIMANARLRCVGSAQHLKSRFGKGFQVQMKLADVERTDPDYLDAFARLAQHTHASDTDLEGGSEDIQLNLEQTAAALQSFTMDTSLSDKLVETDQTGYAVMSAAKSPVGVPLTQVTSFAVSEARIQAVEKFFSDNFEVYVLRERQFNSVRYEVGSSGVKISSIFALIENNKEMLHCADYGVSQTSLEQVFNMHAASAEEIKHLRDDERVNRGGAAGPNGEQIARVKAVPVKAVPVKAAAQAVPPPREPQYVRGTKTDGDSQSEDGFEA